MIITLMLRGVMGVMHLILRFSLFKVKFLKTTSSDKVKYTVIKFSI